MDVRICKAISFNKFFFNHAFYSRKSLRQLEDTLKHNINVDTLKHNINVNWMRKTEQKEKQSRKYKIKLGLRHINEINVTKFLSKPHVEPLVF